MARDLRPVNITVSEHEAKERFVEFAQAWGDEYPAIVRLWENAWSEFAPFLNHSPKICEVMYLANAVESFHARMR